MCRLISGLIFSSVLAIGLSIVTTKCGVSYNVFPDASKLRVLGGREAHDGDWPWLTSLYVDYRNGSIKFICSGSIISPRFVLTAAHCVKLEAKTYPKQANRLFLRVGSRDRARNGTLIDVEVPYVHPGYSISNQHDIALLQLPTDLQFNKDTAPICLPKNYTEATYEFADVAGWGLIFGENQTVIYSTIAHENSIPFQPIELCKKQFDKPTFSEVDPSIQICAGGQMKGTGQGDSGGPLMVNIKGRYHVVGVTSYGDYLFSGPKGNPTIFDVGVYTRVGPHCEWIKKITNGTAECQ